MTIKIKRHLLISEFEFIGHSVPANTPIWFVGQNEKLTMSGSDHSLMVRTSLPTTAGEKHTSVFGLDAHIVRKIAAVARLIVGHDLTIELNAGISVSVIFWPS